MRAVLLALPLLALGAPAAAQSMDGMSMPGMKMPATKPATGGQTAVHGSRKRKPKAPVRRHVATKSGRLSSMGGMAGMSAPAEPQAGAKPRAGGAMAGMAMGAPPAPGTQPGREAASMPGMAMGAAGAAPGSPAMAGMPGMSQSSMPSMEHGSMQGMAGMGHSGMAGMAGMTMGPTGTVPPVTGTTTAPPPPSDHAADAIWGADAMRGSRALLGAEQGGQTFYMVLLNLLEYQARGGRDGYRWDGEAWYGGDINRLVVKSEGEGTLRRGVDSAEAQALYSRTVGPYWNVQGGVRYDFEPRPSRGYATVGVEGLAPNDFETEAALFLSPEGDLLARLEGYYDQRITQRLILQPRAELNLSAQDMARQGTGSGLVDAELGLRLRYEVRREFAPYVGVSWERQFGDTARFSRARGDDTGGFSFVAGVRTWF